MKVYQDGRQNGHHLSVCSCGHSKSVIFNRILTHFTYGLLLSNSRSSLNTGCVWWTVTKMADKMATTYEFALVYGVVATITKSFLIWFLPIWIASIKLSFKFEYQFCPANDNQDGRHNGGCLLVCTFERCCGHPNSIILIRFLSN